MRPTDALTDERAIPLSTSLILTLFNAKGPKSFAGVSPYNSRSGRRSGCSAAHWSVGRS
jgi:hypothetical protein